MVTKRKSKVSCRRSRFARHHAIIVVVDPLESIYDVARILEEAATEAGF
jgi:hypothetical protein